MSDRDIISAGLKKALDGIIGETLNKVTVKHVKKSVERYAQALVDKHMTMTSEWDPITGAIIHRVHWDRKPMSEIRMELI